MFSVKRFFFSISFTTYKPDDGQREIIWSVNSSLVLEMHVACVILLDTPPSFDNETYQQKNRV